MYGTAAKSHRSGVICYLGAWFSGPPADPQNRCLPGGAGMQRSSRKTVTGQLQNSTGRLFLVFCGRWRWSRSSAVHVGASFLVFCAWKSMDMRGDLLSCLMFGGRSRWSGKSLDTRGELLFILILSSWFLVPVSRWMPGVISCCFLGRCLCSLAARGGPENRWTLGVICFRRVWFLGPPADPQIDVFQS